MASDRSASGVVRGYQRTQATGTEVASSQFAPVCAAVASAADWFWTWAQRWSVDPTSWSWWSTGVSPTRASACNSRSRHFQSTPTRHAVGSGVDSTWRCNCSGGCGAPECVEESKTSSTGASSGRPSNFVRAVCGQGPEKVGDARRGKGSVGFRATGRRESPRKIARVSQCLQGCGGTVNCPSRTCSTSCSIGRIGQGPPRRTRCLDGNTFGEWWCVPSARQSLRIDNVGRGQDQRVDQRTHTGRWRKSRQVVSSPRDHREQDECVAERPVRARCEETSRQCRPWSPIASN